jgi:hypothetical protein
MWCCQTVVNASKEIKKLEEHDKAWTIYSSMCDVGDHINTVTSKVIFSLTKREPRKLNKSSRTRLWNQFLQEMSSPQLLKTTTCLSKNTVISTAICLTSNLTKN